MPTQRANQTNNTTLGYSTNPKLAFKVPVSRALPLSKFEKETTDRLMSYKARHEKNL